MYSHLCVDCVMQCHEVVVCACTPAHASLTNSSLSQLQSFRALKPQSHSLLCQHNALVCLFVQYVACSLLCACWVMHCTHCSVLQLNDCFLCSGDWPALPMVIVQFVILLGVSLWQIMAAC